MQWYPFLHSLSGRWWASTNRTFIIFLSWNPKIGTSWSLFSLKVEDKNVIDNDDTPPLLEEIEDGHSDEEEEGGG